MSQHRSRAALTAGLAFFALGAAALVSCSGGGSSSSPTPLQSPQAHQVAISLKLKVTQTGQQAKGQQAKGQLKSHWRQPKYVSPGTNGVTITVFPTGQSQPGQPTIVVDVSGDSASPCVVDPNNQTIRNCTISFQAPTGLDSFAVSAYDEVPVNGSIPAGAHLLSAGVVTDQQIKQGVVNTVEITLGGQVASLLFAPSILLGVADGVAQSYQIGVEPLDADGYIIIPRALGQSPYNNGGGGNISVAVTSGDPTHQVVLATPSPAPSGQPVSTTYTLNYTGGAVSDAVITAALPGITAATGNFTPLTSSPASLSLNLQPSITSGPLSAQLALSSSPIFASIAGGATQCTVSPPSLTPSTPGAPVVFTVSARNSGNCNVNLTAYSNSEVQQVTQSVPVSVSGTGVGVGIGGGKIKHIVLIIQENRSFDNIFGGLDNNGKPLPGADTISHPDPGDPIQYPTDHNGNRVTMQALHMGFPSCYNPQHDHNAQVTDIDGGKMDGFDLLLPAPIGCPSALPSPAPTDWVYQTILYSDVAPYWQMAEQYAIADHHFEQISSDSFAEHLILTSGTNGGVSHNPGQPDPGWGCDVAGNAGPGYPTDVPSLDEIYYFNPAAPNSNGTLGGPPCFNWPTFPDVLSEHGISWLDYAAAFAAHKPDFGYQWSNLDAFLQDRFGPAWSNVISPESQFLADVANGKLSSFTYITPTLATSDHPRSGADSGPAYVVNIVNAIGESPFWSSTAIFILWDDFGGMYDHVAPPDWPGGNPGGPGPSSNGLAYGLRTGLLVISPWIKQRGLVFKPFTTSAMILKFSEEVLNVQSMGGYDTDPNAADLAQMFDFNQSPNFTFTPFQQQYARHKYSKAQIKAILNKGSNRPPDDY